MAMFPEAETIGDGDNDNDDYDHDDERTLQQITMSVSKAR